MRQRVIAAGLAAATALGLAWTPSRADESARYTYIAGEGGGALLDPRRSPAGIIAPAGYGYFVARGSTLSLHVDDRMALDFHEIPVSVTQGRKTLFNGCMPVRSIITLSGGSPGEPVFVRVGEFVEEFSCSAKATVGVVTISGVTVGRRPS